MMMGPELGYFKMEEAGSGGDGGTGAPPSAAPSAPSSEPAPSAPAAPPSPPASDPPEVNWDDLVADGALPSDDESAPPAGDQPPKEPVVPPVEGQPPAQPPAQAPTPPQPPAQPPAQPPGAPQKTQEEVAAEQKAARASMHEQWSQIYANEMTDETKSALITAPETVLPKLMAQAAMDAVDYARREFAAALPQIIAQHVGHSTVAQKTWSAFESAHKDLAKPEYRQTIADAAKFVKAKRPNLNSEEAMTAVARMARLALGLPEPTPGSGPKDPPPQGTAPAAPHTPIARGRARPAPSAANAEVGADGINWGDLAS